MSLALKSCFMMFRLVQLLQRFSMCDLSLPSEFTDSAQDTFRELEFQHIGYEMKSNGTMDFTRKIYPCPCCYSYGDARTSKQKHAPQCTLATMLRAYEEHVGPGLGAALRDVSAATDAYLTSKQSFRPTTTVPPSASSASLAYDPSMLPKQPPRLASTGSDLLSMTTETTPLPDDGGVGPPPPKPLLKGWGDSLGWSMPDNTGMNLSLPEATASFAMSGAVGFTPRACVHVCLCACLCILPVLFLQLPVAFFNLGLHALASQAIF